MPLRRVAAWSRIYVPNSEHRVAFIAYELSRIGHRRSRRPYQRTRTTTSRNRLGTLIYRQRFISKENSRALFPGLVFFVLRAGGQASGRAAAVVISIEAPSRWLSGLPPLIGVAGPCPEVWSRSLQTSSRHAVLTHRKQTPKFRDRPKAADRRTRVSMETNTAAPWTPARAIWKGLRIAACGGVAGHGTHQDGR